MKSYYYKNEFKPNFVMHERIYCEIKERYKELNSMAKSLDGMMALIEHGKHAGRVGMLHKSHASMHGTIALLKPLRIDSRCLFLKCNCIDCRTYVNAFTLKYVR